MDNIFFQKKKRLPGLIYDFVKMMLQSINFQAITQLDQEYTSINIVIFYLTGKVNIKQQSKALGKEK